MSSRKWFDPSKAPLLKSLLKNVSKRKNNQDDNAHCCYCCHSLSIVTLYIDKQTAIESSNNKRQHQQRKNYQVFQYWPAEWRTIRTHDVHKNKHSVWGSGVSGAGPTLNFDMHCGVAYFNGAFFPQHFKRNNFFFCCFDEAIKLTKDKRLKKMLRFKQRRKIMWPIKMTLQNLK